MLLPAVSGILRMRCGFRAKREEAIPKPNSSLRCAQVLRITHLGHAAAIALQVACSDYLRAECDRFFIFYFCELSTNCLLKNLNANVVEASIDSLSDFAEVGRYFGVAF